MLVTISCIVEGEGEVQALPILLRRIAGVERPEIALSVPRPIRLPRTKVKQEWEFSRALQLAKLHVSGPGGILVLMDADQDCPAELGPALLANAQKICGETPVSVVLAKVEYEAWFLAAAESIAGERGLSESLKAPKDPEETTAAKGWLDRHMPLNRKYKETLDQAALTALFDFAPALQTSSFEKCYREIKRLIA